MGRSKTEIAILAAMATGLTALAAVPALADHAWGSYHWERTTPALEIPVIDHTTGVWRDNGHGLSYVSIANADWNQSDYINSPLYTAPAEASCPIVRDEIHVCNGDYGNTGWVGIASISVTRGRTTHIIAGITKLNDYYFKLAYYDDPIWRQLVTCQEIGHDYGLGHQNEDFSSDLTTSCMEYTDQPAGNEHPDEHDYAMLAEIYAHDHGSTDGGTTTDPTKGNGKGKKLGVVGNTSAEWGTAIGFDRSGRPNVYSRSMNGYDIITHVTWAVGESHDEHSHRGNPRTIEF